MTLLSIPSPDLQYFQIGPIRIYLYALCIITGIVVAAIITDKRLVKRGGERGAVIDFTVWSVVLGIVGARIYHVLTHWGDYFGPGANLTEVFAIWNGGIAIFGALLGGALGVWIASRLTGIRFWSFADALVPGLLIAQAFGRLGNYFNQELFGEPTTLPWGLEIAASNPAFPIGLPAGTLFHPTFLYEILWNLAGVALLLMVEKQLRPRWGQFFAMYLVWYGIGRFWIEGMRLDPSFLFLGLRTNQLAAVLAVLFGVLIYVAQRERHTGLEANVYLPGRQDPTRNRLQKTADPDKFFHVLAHPNDPSEIDTEFSTGDTSVTAPDGAVTPAATP